MIGFTVGFIGFLLHNVVDCIEEPILERSLGYGWQPFRLFLRRPSSMEPWVVQPWLIELASEGNIALAWLWRTGIGIILAGVSSVIIVYFRPSAGGSGIPELIAFLNGTSIRHIYNVRTLLAKFISCAFAVSSGKTRLLTPVWLLKPVTPCYRYILDIKWQFSGLFAGPEGPMIHIGALVGAGLSQFKSDSIGINIGEKTYALQFRLHMDF